VRKQQDKAIRQLEVAQGEDTTTKQEKRRKGKKKEAK